MPVSDHHPLQGSQSIEPHGASRVQLVRGNSDFSTEAIFVPVREARRGVDHDRAGIDFPDEAAGAAEVFGHDRVGVLRAVGGDVIDRFVEPRDDAGAVRRLHQVRGGEVREGDQGVGGEGRVKFANG